MAAQVIIAVVAVSSSAVLVRWADAPAEALAFWRTAGGALILAPAARRSPGRPGRAQWMAIGVAGAALAVHFSTWLASLELTSVAASVTLVTTAPLMIAIGAAVAGRRPPMRTWIAIAVAIVGVAVITLGTPSSEGATGPGPSDPTLGNALALVGAAAMALYLVAGDRVRTSLSTAAYAARAYAVAALALAGYAAVTGLALWGFDPRTWLAIAGMIVGPQLAGHTMLNLLLERLGSVTVSTLLLAETVGAGLLVWLLFGEVPPAAAWVGAPLVIGAVALQLRAVTATTDRSGGATDGEPVSDARRSGSGRPEPAG